MTGRHAPRDRAPSRGMPRDAFLRRLATALGRDAAAPPPPPAIDAALIRLCRRDADLPARFADGARASGMTLETCDAPRLGATVAAALGRLGARTAIAALRGPDDLATIERAVRGTACRLVEADDGFDDLYDLDAGITDVAAAVAETGSLVIASGPRHRRGAAIVPPIHVAIVRERQIVADLVDLFAEADAAVLPASMMIVTGPSKTADIEGILVTGVHGPGVVHVILVRG